MTTGAGPRVRVLPPGVFGEQLRDMKAQERIEAGLPVETDAERKTRMASQNSKRAVKHCSKCGLSGHSKSTCDRQKNGSAAPADAETRTSRAHAGRGEVATATVRRRDPGQKPQTCGLCGDAGHNKITCPKRGEPRKGATRSTSAGRPTSRASAPTAKPEQARQLVVSNQGGGIRA